LLPKNNILSFIDFFIVAWIYFLVGPRVE